MIPFYRTACCLAAALFVAAIGFAEAGAARAWAVVVGIDKYADPSVPSLQFSKTDALAFYDFACSDAGFGVDPERVVCLLNEDATVANIRSALGDHLAKQAAPEDTVVFFFAGHGGDEVDFLAPGKPQTAKFLVAHDTRVDRFYGTAFNMADDLAYLVQNRIRAKRFLCFLDCCHSGAAKQAGVRGIHGRGISGTAELNIAVPAESETLLLAGDSGKEWLLATACEAVESAGENSELGHGLFTYATLKLLSGQADGDGDGAITVAEFQSGVTDLLGELSKGRQHPVVDSSLPAAHVLARAGYVAGSMPLTVPAFSSAEEQSTPQTRNDEFVFGEGYLTQVRTNGDSLLVAVVSSPGKVSNLREALADARRKQRQELQKYLQVSSDEVEKVYDSGEIVDAQELEDRSWYLVMRYSI